MADNRPAAIIQARMGSERLPGKSMRLLAGKPLIEHVAQAAARIEGVTQVILATTKLPEDDILADFAQKRGLPVWRGETDDVAARFLGAAREYGADPIVRICGDSPIPEVDQYARQLAVQQEQKADLTFYAHPFLPLGPFGDVLSLRALEKTVAQADKPYQREHVSPYIHEHPDAFKLVKLDAPEELFKGDDHAPRRLTVDTEEDLAMMNTLYRKLAEKALPPTLPNALAVLQENPDIAAINQGVRQRTATE